MADTLLQITGLTKSYTGIKALDGIDIAVCKGRVHALVGENGAGKSTLIKILTGVIQADSGTINLEGRALGILSPHYTRKLRIEVVHQHTSLIPYISIAENFALRQGYSINMFRKICWSKLYKKAGNALSAFLPDINIKRKASALSGVEQQMVELAFAIAPNPKLLILDEPTAVLPGHETELLFEHIRRISSQGTAVIFVSHRLDEIFQIAQRVTVVRDGRIVWHKDIEQTDHNDLIEGMVGRKVTFKRDPACIPDDAIGFELKSLADDKNKLKNISLNIKKGEIYGIYGLVGAGQSDLCHSIFGLGDIASGQINLGTNNSSVYNMKPADRVKKGIAYVPSDRMLQGLFYQMSVVENMSISSLKKLSPNGFIDQKQETGNAVTQIDNLQIKTQGPGQNVSELSGGNQQKVLLGRWLLTNPKVLILEEPTQGVDVGAKGQIHNIIRAHAKQGVSILLISSELPELMALSHRIGIINNGRIVGEVNPENTSESQILKLSLPENNKKLLLKQKHSEKNIFHAGLSWLLSKRELSILGFVVFLSIIFSFTVPGFFSLKNINDILTNNSILLIGALGMSFVIISGGIDVSAGAILGLCAVFAGFADKAMLPPVVICIISIAAGILLSSINGIASVFGRVHPIIITLGTMSIYRGLMIEITGARWLLNLSEKITLFGQSKIFGFSILLVLGAIITCLAYYFLTFTASGRNLYALGGDRKKAYVLGIYPKNIVPLAFALNGLCLGIAALLHAGRYGQVQTNIGVGFELKVIGAAVIGGTHIMGGRGNAIGVLFGALLIGIISNVIVLSHISAFWEGAFMGILILLAIGCDSFTDKYERMLQG